MRGSWTALAALALASCGQSAPLDNDSMSGQDQRAAVPAIEDLTGRWRVVAIDGVQLPETAGAKKAHFTIAPDALGGYIGCNSFGGLALYAKGRFAVSNWGGDAMACPWATDQEQALSDLFFGHPKVIIKQGRVTIRSRDHVLELADRADFGANDRLPDPMRIPVTGNISQQLAGTQWRISYVDRQSESVSSAERVLSFTEDGWRGLASCATLFGNYRLSNGRLLVEGDMGATEQNCSDDYAKIDTDFADMMRARPHYLVGPNGELIMAGGGHVLVAMRQQ